MRIFKGILLALVFTCCIIIGSIWYLFTHVTVDFSSLENYNPGSYSVVLDDHGVEIARFQLDRREPVDLDALSPHLIHAFLAAEDQQFFKHHGICIPAMFRSFFKNFTRGKIVQGASTITQQLIKLLFLDSSRTFKRKTHELFLALIVEHQFSKQQILQTYLNHIYLGCGIYGVEAASLRFWNKHASDLTVAQAATLAAIVQSPERLCPLMRSPRTLTRRNYVLRHMLGMKKITRDEYDQALNEQLELSESAHGCCAPHIKEMIRQTVESLVGTAALYSSGLVIQTTLNQTLQQQSVSLFAKHLQHHQEESAVPLDGGLFVIEGATGKIKALVGGLDFSTSQFNRVTQAKRQLGSIFKPLIYATALEHGARMDDICNDEPITIEHANQVWEPQNYNHKFIGPVTRAYGLYKSLNTIAIQTLYKAGFDNVVHNAQACGLACEHAYPSLALGCLDATLWQATRMFNCFAQQGILVEPYYIEWIKDGQGKKVYKHTVEKHQALSWHITSQVTATLCAGMQQLRKKGRLVFPDAPFMGKTGTTNDARSCFFVGATPRYTAGAFIGNDDNLPMGKYIFASQTVLPLILDVLKTLDTGSTTQFMYHPELQPLVINAITGFPVRRHDRDDQVIELLVPAQTP